jgi:hypothetical protein
MVSLYEWRQGKPRPNEFWLVEWTEEDGSTRSQVVEVVSWPTNPGEPEKSKVYARTTIGNPCSAIWIPLAEFVRPHQEAA